MSTTSADIDRAVRLLLEGSVVGLPTDTLYGIGAIPTNADAVARLYQLKGRPSGKPVALLVASVADAERLVGFTSRARALADAHWPGPLTLVLPMVADLPEWVGDRERRTVGVRVPDFEVTHEVLRRTGPLAVTSANLSEEDPTLDDAAAREVFGDEVAFYLPGRSPGARGSTVVDVTTDSPQVLRLGPVSLD